MEKVLPIVIICGVGLFVCALLLILIFVRALKKRRFSRCHEEFELDEHSLTIKLDKKDFRK